MPEDHEGKLGVAVVGLGVGAAHARAYLADGRCELRWLHDIADGRADSLARELGAGAIARTYAAILADPAVDVVSIASFDDAHYEQALAALRAGKHVFVEKPLCRTRSELETLRRAWDEAGRPQLASNLVLRAAPLYGWLRSQQRDGELGEVYAFDGDYFYGRLHKITDGWRRDVADYSVMLGGGVHLVDLLLWITGQRPTGVSAAGNRISTEATEFRYLDHVAATYSFDSGLVARITANFGSVHPHQHVVRLFGTRATVIHDDQGPRRYVSREPDVPAERLDLAALPSTKGDLIPGFIDAIVARADTSAASEHEFAVISACVAADEAVVKGVQVDIDYG